MYTPIPLVLPFHYTSLSAPWTCHPLLYLYQLSITLPPYPYQDVYLLCMVVASQIPALLLIRCWGWNPRFHTHQTSELQPIPKETTILWLGLQSKRISLLPGLCSETLLIFVSMPMNGRC